ncbi:hypothetical protein Tco_0271456 [Tanacetum coccineum]
MSLRTTVLAQQSQIRELQSADRRRQTVISEMLAADHKRQKQLTEALKLIKRLQTQMAEFERHQGVTAVLAARDANTNGVDSHNSGTGARRNERATRECTYPDFMKCQPLNFKGTEGVVKLTQWIEKMETVFRISNYSVENQIKFSTCTLLGNALTMFPEESDKIEKYVGGLPNMIHGSVATSVRTHIFES